MDVRQLFRVPFSALISTFQCPQRDDPSAARRTIPGILISFPAGATKVSGIRAWPDRPEGQHWAVPAHWEANRAARRAATADN